MTSVKPTWGAVVFAWSGAAVFLLALLYFLYSYLVRFGLVLPDGTRLPAVLANVLLFSLFALHHSLLARPWMKARVAAIVHPALERSTYTWTASLLFLLVCWSWRPVPGELYRATGVGGIVGYVIQGLGVVLTIRSSARLDALDLAGVRPVLHARAGHQTTRTSLETTGLYGLVRHPLYLAWALLVFGTPHMTGTRLVFAAVSTAYLVLAIPFEERCLLRTFGSEYRAYQARVRWRMIPGIY